MKRIISLALSCSLCALCVLPTNANAAIDISASGALTMRSQYYDNVSFLDNKEQYNPFNIGSNLMLGLGLAVSQDLYGVITLRNLDPVWGGLNGTGTRSNGWVGRNSDLSGFLLGHLQYNTKYLNFTAGQFTADKGSYTFGSSFVNSLPLAGVQVRINASEKAKIDVAYFRPYAKELGFAAAYGGTIDMLELSVPLDFDEFKIRPYASAMMIGENVTLAGITSGEVSTPTYLTDIAAGIYGTTYITTTPLAEELMGKTTAYIGGFSASLNPVDQLVFTLDVHYGASDTALTAAGKATFDAALSGADSSNIANRAGFIVGASASYTMTFGTLGIVGWYASGDDDDPSNGSERAVTFNSAAPNITAKVAGPFAGDMLFDTDPAVIAPNYPGFVQLPGTAGVTVGLKNINFASRLMHSIWANYTVGTNDPLNPMLALIGNGTTLMSSDDSVIQLGLVNWFPFTQNLIGALEVAYGISRFDETKSTNIANPLMVDLRVNYVF